MIDWMESSTYRAILREGREEGKAEVAKLILLRQGCKRFGPPKAAVKKTIEAITDINRLEKLADRIFDAKSWAEWMDGS
jgi:hypothetical protein